MPALHMSRPVEGLPHAGALLARALDGDRPEWVSVATWRRLQAVRDDLRSDAARALGDGPTVAAEALRVGRSTLARWTAPGGWLSRG